MLFDRMQNWLLCVIPVVVCREFQKSEGAVGPRCLVAAGIVDPKTCLFPRSVVYHAEIGRC